MTKNALIMQVLLLLAFLLPVDCLGFSWPRETKEKMAEEVRTSIPEDLDGLLNNREFGSLRIGLDALQTYSRKPDCFKKAARAISAQCAELDMDEDARVNAAISMTLCEIATAKHYSLPLECHSFSLDDMQGKALKSQTQGECVDSLARSAQFWSSYSGYLREVPQLCEAFRRWNDIDLARDIYQNVTIEKIALIRFILDREKKSAQYDEQLNQRIPEIQQLVFNMKVSSDMYRLISERLISEVNGSVNGTLASLRVEIGNYIVQRQRAEEQAVANLQESSEVILREHANRLYSITDAFDVNLNHRLEFLFTGHEVKYQNLSQLTIEIQSRLQEIGHEFSMMKQAISLVSDTAGQILNTQVMISRKADFLSDIQSKASESAIGLVEALTQMTDTARIELDKINGSAWLIQEHLRFQENGNLQWKGWLMNVLAFIYRAEPSSFGNLGQLLSFRLFLSVFTFCWNVFRAMFSALTTIIIVFFLMSRNFVLKRSARILSSAIYPLPASRPLHASTSALPGSTSRQRVSRIPDRLCRPSPY